jgi:uncharacterized membrane protein (DUF2068 family)
LIGGAGSACGWYQGREAEVADVDWNLRTCGRRGHVTYAPTEPGLRARLHTGTAVGEAWRCLRCGDFALGPAKLSGPADDAPIVLRGRALRDAVVLRLLAVERLVKGTVVLVAAYGVYRFRSHQDAVERAFREDLPLLRPFADKIGWNLDESTIVHTLRAAIEARSNTLLWVIIGLLVYGGSLLVEGVGLWVLKRWGEYFAVLATSVGLPVEIYELTEKITWLRVGAFVINVAAVVYISFAKRLFGLRGGRAAEEAERHETSLLEVEIAAAQSEVPTRLRSPRAPAGVG